MSTVTPPAAPLPGETCPGVATWDDVVPHRPGTRDWNGLSLQNNGGNPPNPGTHPTAALLNAIMAQLDAYGAVVPNARLSIVGGNPPTIAFVTGASTWVNSLLAAGFRITRNGAGDVSITWAQPSGTTTWAFATAYTSGTSYIVPRVANGYYYKCTTSGTSHATTEPIWPTTIGSIVSDGTAAWTCWGSSNAFPAPVSQPAVSFNISGGLTVANYSISAENITNGVRVTTNLNGSPTDLSFSVSIY